MPIDYAPLLEALKAGGTTLDFRRRLAAKAYARTAAYDAAISNWFAEQLDETAPDFPRLRRHARRGACAMARTRTRPRPSIARPSSAPGVATARQVQGKQLSYNNINDTDAAYECVAEFDPARSRGLRHRQACQSVRRCRGRDAGRGLSQGAAPATRPRRSAASSRSTARSMREAARAITEIFTEVIVAPDATEEAIAIVGAKKNLRLLLAGGLPDPRASGLTGEIRRGRTAGADRATMRSPTT